MYMCHIYNIDAIIRANPLITNDTVNDMVNDLECIFINLKNCLVHSYPMNLE